MLLVVRGDGVQHDTDGLGGDDFVYINELCFPPEVWFLFISKTIIKETITTNTFQTTQSQTKSNPTCLTINQLVRRTNLTGPFLPQENV